ncbi:MAG: precorrin-2 C(20)-methyltransferase [Proteobacteria bacterium]|nr:precorrin-2 C(20)-methyltransferase [Pseudomonadota bacterium]
MGGLEAVSGRVYGIGIGPGDPDLITVKALKRLQAAAVIVYPALEDGDSLARAIVACHLPGGQREIVIRVPMLAERFPAQEVYDHAALEIGRELEAGCDVAVLCQGDPFFYGSFMYLFGRLAQRFPVEVIPGVSSLTASAAVLGAPLAARNDVLTVIPAPLPEAELERRLAATDAAAIIKVGRHLEKVRRVLSRLGLIDRCRYVEHATMQNQRILALGDVTVGEAPYFSMVLVHARGEAWR